MLKLMGYLIIFVTCIIFPFVVVMLLVLIGKQVAKFYQAMIHPKKISEKMDDNIFGIWVLTLIVVWLSLLFWVIPRAPAGPAQILALLDNTFGYKATEVHITLTEELDEQLIKHVLEPWIRMGGREIQRRTSHYASVRHGGRGRIVRYTDTAYIPSRYRQVDQQLEIVMGKELSGEWLWMLEKGWQNEPKTLARQLAAEMEFKRSKETIYVQPYSIMYEKNDDGYCHLQATINIPARSFAGLWLVKKIGAEKDTPMRLYMGEDWPGGIRIFELESIKPRRGQGVFTLAASQETVYLRPLNEHRHDVSCAEIQQLESSSLAAISLRNRITRWVELQPYIKDVQLNHSRFVPWLAVGKAWQILSQE